MKKYNKAQGTIEYLVIIGIVVVLSLVVVGFILTQTNTIGDVSNNSNQLSSATNQLAIKETVIGTDGNGLLVIQNNSPDTITLNKIVSGPITLTYNQIIVQGNTNNISIDLLAQTCVCGTNDKTKTCPIEITYTNQYRIIKKQIQNITLNCVTTFRPAQTTNQPTTITTTQNCFDATQDPIPICTLTDLNRMRENLTANYQLQADINAAETLTWNSAAGWEPLGPDYDAYFTGSFDGRGHTISNLYIYRPSTFLVGLFGNVGGSAYISNVGVIDANITGTLTGVLIGYNNGLVNATYSTGDINGGYNVGGLIGYNSMGGIIKNSYSNTNVIGFQYDGALYAGGLAGFNYDSLISNSYSTGSVTVTNGSGSAGGLIGEEETATVTNSFTTSNVNEASSIGGLIGNTLEPTLITNNYWDTYLTGQSKCYVDSNTGCTATNNQASLYYGANGIPFNTETGLSFDGNWKAVEGSYPKLTWQTQ